jgi:F420-non-reducing hydrogenase large subunit
MSVQKAAAGLISKDVDISEGLLNTIEMAYRAYDPCMACATHTLPGQMPLEIILRAPDGEIIKKLAQNLD